jgi:hypothetical protein
VVDGQPAYPAPRSSGPWPQALHHLSEEERETALRSTRRARRVLKASRGFARRVDRWITPWVYAGSAVIAAGEAVARRFSLRRRGKSV